MSRQVSAPLALLSFAALLIAHGCGGSEGTEPRDPFPSATIAEIDRQVGQFISEDRSPGVMISVTTPEGSWSKAYGVAEKSSGTPMALDMQTRIGSITKSFTTTLALLLVKEGRLSLEDKVSKYVSGIPRGDEITVRMLGNMTAGLPEYLANADFREAFFAEPNRVWTPYELLDYAFEAPNSFDPGESSSYSNANTVVLGLVVERAAGKPFHQVLEEKILKPLDLSGTGFPLNELFTGDHVNGYFASFLPTRPETDSTFWSPSQAWAAGQMISTVGDLTRWIRTIGNGSLVGPSLQAERLKWEPIGDNNDVWHYTFGLEENSGWLGHNGEIPGFDTFAVYHPQLDATIVIVINTDKRVDGQPPINVLLRNLSGVFFPGHTVEVPVVG